LHPFDRQSGVVDFNDYIDFADYAGFAGQLAAAGGEFASGSGGPKVNVGNYLLCLRPVLE